MSLSVSNCSPVNLKSVSPAPLCDVRLDTAAVSRRDQVEAVDVGVRPILQHDRQLADTPQVQLVACALTVWLILSPSRHMYTRRDGTRKASSCRDVLSRSVVGRCMAILSNYGQGGPRGRTRLIGVSPHWNISRRGTSTTPRSQRVSSASTRPPPRQTKIMPSDTVTSSPFARMQP